MRPRPWTALALITSALRPCSPSARWSSATTADSAYSWRLEPAGEEAQRLLELLLQAGAMSHLVPPDTSRAAICEIPDQPVEVVHQRHPSGPGLRGRVAFQVVVDTLGLADMDTFVPMLATDSSLQDAARRMMAGSRFRPAVWRGHAMAQMVHRVIVWR
jgi:hypothetical protein